MASAEVEPMEIDDALYSRQRYVLGDSAMHKMAKSRVFLFGLDGLGVEVAKNIVLAGVKELVIHDIELVTVSDIGTQFFLRDSDIGKNRADVSCSRLAELNPYVSVKVLKSGLTDDLSTLDAFTCVIFVNCLCLQLLESANNRCRSASPQIRFISASVFGVFASVFNDFGDSFEVLDRNGEEPAEFFVGQVSQEEDGKVSCIENELHGLEDGDYVSFKEVEGMTELNNGEYKVRVISPKEFAIGDTRPFSKYKTGGICRQVKKPINLSFQPLHTQLFNPSLLLCDLGKMEAPPQNHLAYITLLQFVAKENRKPNPRDQSDLQSLLQLSDTLISKFEGGLIDKPDSDVIKDLADTSIGCLQPLCAAMGGIVAQEALIALTNKFTPIQQWIHLDAREVIPRDDIGTEEFNVVMDRYDPLRVCIGNTLLEKLRDVNAFMVGCGAIGCEMIKNIALLGMCRKGKFVITDNDLIEKSNLNRQFLFRDRHITQAKSTTASQSALEINRDLKIEPHLNKVGPQTEHSHYPDEFFKGQDIIINALDNVETRMYMDNRCVANERPLLESGTMGAKGHVQVIVPFMTESYASQVDPLEKGIPYCTMKSFPATIEHCTLWSRDKFETLFVQKPEMFQQFWSENVHPSKVLAKMQQGNLPENCVPSIKILERKVTNFKECVEQGRGKFEKYFNHKARNLLHAFPDKHENTDGTPFWTTPKRKPDPIQFDSKNSLHLDFVVSCARLLAFRSGISVTDKECEIGAILSLVESAPIPKWKKSGKKIETDETKTKEAEPIPSDNNAIEQCIQYLARLTSSKESAPISKNQLIMHPNKFEKDDDANCHINFITAASNLRAKMYSIESGDRLKVKRIAGRIVPAIATTTAAISGLVSLELIKLVRKCKLEQFRNCFMSLSVPTIVFSEPGAATRHEVCPGVSVTLWDKWEVRGNPAFTVKQFITEIMDRFKIKPTGIIQGVKMVYVSLMPGHTKRLSQPISKYITQPQSDNYVDLVVAFENEEGEEINGPPIRYFLA